MKTGKPEETSLDTREKKTNSAPKSAGGSSWDDCAPLRQLETRVVVSLFAGVTLETLAYPDRVSLGVP